MRNRVAGRRGSSRRAEVAAPGRVWIAGEELTIFAHGLMLGVAPNAAKEP